jgi:hypothetical protein
MSLARREIYRFAEILRSADSAQDDSNQTADSEAEPESWPAPVTSFLRLNTRQQRREN